MILTDARTRTRSLVDDANSAMWTDAEVDVALNTAQYETLLWVVASGSTLLNQEATVFTDGQGLASMTTIAPLKIVSVSTLSGTTRCRIEPVLNHDIVDVHLGVQSLKVTYVPRPVFPASGADAFVWGSASMVLPPADGYLCALAASELKIKEGEQLRGLTERKEELRAALMSLINMPSWTAMPFTSRRAYRGLGLGWTMTGADQLQLVRL